MSRSPTYGALVFVSLAFACSPPPETVDASCEAGTGSVQVGRGGSRLRTLPAEGGDLEIVQGAQGGVHVIVGAWVQDVDLEMTMRYRLEQDGVLVGTETVVELRAALFAPSGERFVRHPDLIVLDNDRPAIEDFADREVDLMVQIQSVDGTNACDSRRVTLRAPSG